MCLCFYFKLKLVSVCLLCSVVLSYYENTYVHAYPHTFECMGMYIYIIQMLFSRNSYEIPSKVKEACVVLPLPSLTRISHVMEGGGLERGMVGRQTLNLCVSRGKAHALLLLRL